MGTAQIQGELWGANAADWAQLQEPAWTAVYEAVLMRMGIAAGTPLLDIGCGAGGALSVARALGAQVSGLDASAALVTIARARLPGAPIEIGEMEQLPFPDASFDVVTGFNSFQFAADPVQALREARRVCRPRGKVAMLVWGRKQDCDLLATILPAVTALLPPSPPGGPSSPPLSSPGVIPRLMREAALTPCDQGDIDALFAYSDAEVAYRAIASAGMLVRAARIVGESALYDAIVGALEPFIEPDGSVRLHNRFRWVLATRA